MNSRPTSILPDRAIYFVISEYKDGDFTTEVALIDTGLVTTIKDIRDGQFGDVTHVIEVDLARGTSRDATADFDAVLNEVWEHRNAPS